MLYPHENQTSSMHIVQLVSEDLPEAMMESARERQRLALVVGLNHTYARTAPQIAGSEIQGSLFAALRLTTHRVSSQFFLGSIWFKVFMIGCLVAMAMTLVVRYIQWRRHCRGLSTNCVPFCVKLRHRNDDFYCDKLTNMAEENEMQDDNETVCVGMAMPLLHEVTTL